MRTGLVLEARDNALAARGPGIGIGELVAHHDRGSQYTSGTYRDRLFAEGIIPSVGHMVYATTTRQRNRSMRPTKKELIYQHVWRDARARSGPPCSTTSSNITITSGNNVGSAR